MNSQRLRTLSAMLIEFGIGMVSVALSTRQPVLSLPALLAASSLGAYTFWVDWRRMGQSDWSRASISGLSGTFRGIASGAGLGISLFLITQSWHRNMMSSDLSGPMLSYAIAAVTAFVVRLVDWVRLARQSARV